MPRLAALLLLLFTGLHAATAGSLPGFEAGTTTVEVSPRGGLDLSKAGELVLEGRNPGKAPVLIGLRLDDAASASYATRYDLERSVPPGPFRLRTAPSEWRTPSGRVLDPSRIVRIVVSAEQGRRDILIDDLRTEATAVLPPGAAGFRFGPPTARSLPGFEIVAPGDKRLAGNVAAIVRRGVDPLLTGGLRGIEHFRTPWPDGRWTVTLWTGDPGEFEWVPHFLDRRIRINGETVLEEHRDSRVWLRDTYLAGLGSERIDDPWEAFGRRRAGMISADVTVRDGALDVELAGDAAATFLSAILVEPVGHAARDTVEQARRARFLEAWPQLGPRDAPRSEALAAFVLPQGRAPALDSRPDAVPPPPPVAPQGGIASIDVMVSSPADDPTPEVTLDAPERGGVRLPIDLRWGQWRFRRAGTGALHLTPSHLRAVSPGLTLRSDAPRRLNLLVQVPDDAPAGRYSGRVRVTSRGAATTATIVLDVAPARLPAPDRPIGPYLELPAFLPWFPEFAAERPRWLACDLTALRRFGLSGVAPPFATPTHADAAPFRADLETVRAAGFTQPVLAYSPIKRIIDWEGLGNLTRDIAALHAALAGTGLVPPAWSIADEPGNPGSTATDMAAIRTAIQLGWPDAVIAGHLNAPADRKYLDLFDLVLVNHGFGVFADELAALRQAGITPWLYNMPAPELAAGLFLWRTGAAGYLQWHARATTADPYDPTDGGEDDFQMLPVGAAPCPAVPDIDDSLLALARAVQDLRWMLWLDDAATRAPAARRLRAAIAAQVPDHWSAGDTMAVDLPAIRSRLAALASDLAAGRGN